MSAKSISKLVILFIFAIVLFSGCATRIIEKDPYAMPERYRRAPDGAIWLQEVKKRAVPPSHYTTPYVVPWAHAATTKRGEKGVTGKIIQDYLKLYAIFPDGSRQEVYYNDYNRPLSSYDSGLYIREDRWYSTDKNIPTKIFVKDGNLIVDAAATPDVINHWWGWRKQCPKEAIGYAVEARVKVIGRASVQFGIDFWIDGNKPHNGYVENCVGSNNCEALVTDWTHDTDGDFIVFRATTLIPKTAKNN